MAKHVVFSSMSFVSTLSQQCGISTPVTAFTVKHGMKAYLKRRLGTFTNPLVYTFGAHQGPSIMTMSAALADG